MCLLVQMENYEKHRDPEAVALMIKSMGHRWKNYVLHYTFRNISASFTFEVKSLIVSNELPHFETPCCCGGNKVKVAFLASETDIVQSLSVQ